MLAHSPHLFTPIMSHNLQGLLYFIVVVFQTWLKYKQKITILTLFSNGGGVNQRQCVYNMVCVSRSFLFPGLRGQKTGRTDK